MNGDSIRRPGVGDDGSSDDASGDRASNDEVSSDERRQHDRAPSSQDGGDERDALVVETAASSKVAEKSAPAVASPLRAAERFLVDFFGARVTGEAAALFRIAYGVLAVWESLAVWLNLERYFSSGAVIPFDLVKNDPYAWMGLFSLAPDSNALLYGHAIVFTVASVLLLLGVFPRIMALVVCYVNISLQFRNPYILNSGDRLFQIAAGLAVLMPLGRRWSVDAWARARLRKPRSPMMAVYGQRLLQLTVAYVYLSSCIAKLMNVRWLKGIALRDVLSSPVYSEWARYYDVFPIVFFLTWTTLVFELAFPLLVWWKKLRPWLILSGIAFHVGIDTLMVIPMFSAIMIVSYAVFLTDAEVKWLVGRIVRPFRGAPAPTVTTRTARPDLDRDS